jgi:hypothetical protein
MIQIRKYRINPNDASVISTGMNVTSVGTPIVCMSSLLFSA